MKLATYEIVIGIIIIEDMNATDSLPDMSTYSAGAYLLKLVSAEGIQYTKIIKI